ncbi:multicopper oxidase family protein [Nocardioides flavus (ex Wang et al. 2016)]|uniref:multicopper oxidase family protein n=1 Tax=Nocardioides flavus (ex Wang et al. 2016) TaxID=2058780 RepID=UPI001E601B8C|nr:multicopper oxidase family protein [Nocardioides flavus (ex Wang et al. 2016)]
MSQITRRAVLRGTAGLAGVATLGGLASCSRTSGSLVGAGVVGPGADVVAAAEAARRRSGARLITARLTPRQVTVDLGGPTVTTWAYGDTVPGPLLRATAGDVLRVDVDNQLPDATSVHWHGIALRNDMDGVPGMTQDPIPAGGTFRYEFTVPDPGTYFYHPHSGVQLDRGLYGVLIVDSPHGRGQYDAEWVVVLDDWVDGTGRTPDQILAELQQASEDGPSGGMHDMEGMDHGSMGGSMGGMEAMQSPLLGGAGDIAYPHYLLNGRTPADPVTLSAKPGQRVRIRFVNAGSDTAFRVAVGGHRMTVTHSDGFPTMPVPTDALLIGMGERFDVLVTLGNGVFPLVASAEGKKGQALAVIRSGAGRPPAADVRIRELAGQVLLGTDLAPAESARLDRRSTDRRHDLALGGTMAPYRWTINAKTFPDSEPLQLVQGERVRLRFLNQSMMFHPMHVHGHTFALAEGGARKDTVIVRPMQTVEVDLEADNPGQWAAHCHNIYHAEAGMMTTLSYQAKD